MAEKRNITANDLLEKAFNMLTRDSKDILFLPHKVMIDVECEDDRGNSAEIGTGYYVDAVIAEHGAYTWLLSLGRKCNSRTIANFGSDIFAIKFEQKPMESKLCAQRRAMEVLARNSFLVNSLIYSTRDGSLAVNSDSPFHPVVSHLLSKPETKGFVAREAQFSREHFEGANRPLLLSETKYLPMAVRYFYERIRDILALA